ncbi:MAG: hypothetical protein KME57_31390, partial [Scytonema hyalinum WJT4-NPBG1]|nr:hypothetical protein [Scytonema hyalinum WJT4-NPBG1]
NCLELMTISTEKIRLWDSDIVSDRIRQRDNGKSQAVFLALTLFEIADNLSDWKSGSIQEKPSYAGYIV